MTDLVQQLASEIAARPNQVEAAIRLIDEGASVPFIARYRKEVTQGLDDVQLRQLDTRLNYLRDLNERREKVIQSLTEQEKLNDDLLARINAVTTKNALEEIYAPYRPKRSSKSFKAKEAGLGPIATQILTQDIDPQEALVGFSHEDYADLESQLDAVQHIIIDEWAQNIALSVELKKIFAKTAILKSAVASDEKKEVGKKFRDYFEFSENLNKVASHRLLAMLRGRQENVLGLKIDGENDAPLAAIWQNYTLDQIQPAARQAFLQQTATLFWSAKIRPQIEHSLLTEKRLAAEAEAVDVFSENLRHLLLSAPAGGRCTLGVDPGVRTGVKLAVVNASGDVVAHSTVYPFAPKEDKAGAKQELARLCRDFSVELVAIGNGTASRETENVIAEMMAENTDLTLTRVTVSEAGASVYSASELASQELPDLDVSIRGAVSIARRLQDPLAELVKIDPKSIGVGQYQHDVNQTGLNTALEAVIEDCVNAVGVDVNTASPAILAHIAGLNKAIAQQIVEYRKAHGQFTNRQTLKNVPRLGERTFEQAAGFLRIHAGEQALDASAVHPESYDLVERIAQAQNVSVQDLIGQTEIIRKVNVEQFVDEAQVGILTVKDVLSELEKPGRDPRPEFRTAKFRDDIVEVAHLTEGLELEGVVTNVTNFGAFVDVGVHQDGLVHISELANEFVADPQKIVKPGQIVKVRVIHVDVERKRVNLSMRPEGSQAEAKQQRVTTRREKPSDVSAATKTSNKRTSPRANTTPQNKQRTKQDKPQEQKIGGLGALLLQAGIKNNK
ncbi:RNA-binding transcriptional accessory protein [Acinetobacter sp. B5B]|uniref:Tex family protein n=1 Tax=Acinetobacter baretiae TaxID=2605383 RepID=UPI0018C24F1C|nr:Tex family protein [Acinetobacter baretiae]MBF7682196.1 RNA-binding transcriptional accessory protein [Acinetobacter baretiae]MBF7685023.1 RNA-binding transcriptional accessory protein [Acinetobacter baretiae]